MALVLLLGTATTGLCQTETVESPEPDPSTVTEEIVVYGEKNILHLRAEVHRAETIYLDKFNLLNSNDEFDFDCKVITLLETRARKRVCVPKFARKYEAKMAAAMIRDGNFQTPPRLRAQLRKYEKQLAVEMLTLTREHPELQQAYTAMSAAKTAYEAELEERRKK